MEKRQIWRNIGASLLLGLLIAYLDRTVLSVALPAIAHDMGFEGPGMGMTSSWALTAFLIGYAVANIVGGLFTRKRDPKYVVIWCFAAWSMATFVVGFTSSVAVLLICRVIVGVGEGVYWPQQSRFAKAWFAPEERSRANAWIQYYGQFISLALGFAILTPLYHLLGWRNLFFLTGAIGFLVVVPLYMKALPRESQAPYYEAPSATSRRLTLADFGGPSYFLLLFTYIAQGMMFWGITLWIPMAVRTLGFTTPMGQALASAVPYLAAVVLAVPMTRISDATGRRVAIATSGLLIPGLLMISLPFVASGVGKLALVTIALGYYASTFTPNVWSILQATVAPEAVGPASGIMNGLGAGGGGTIAGFLVGVFNAKTGSYIPGFVTLGFFALAAAVSLMIYGHIQRRRRAASAMNKGYARDEPARQLAAWQQDNAQSSQPIR